MHVIYLDFRKAFDSVSHSKLLLKLQSYGISGALLQWYKAYLTSCFQYVRINNTSSDLVPVLSGVPQGSILGPLLFALFINDLPSCLHFSKPFIYADDTKCLWSTTRGVSIDIYPLQSDLDELFLWSQTSELYFNDSKFAHMHFWSEQLTDAVTYYINGKTVSPVVKIKDLGILLSSSLVWDDHYNFILSKAYKILGLIRRTFSTNLIPIKKKLYISLVRAQILYCSQVWRPYKIKDILLLEQAQRRATKYILNDYYSSYKSRLMKLKLFPLIYIFEINDIMFFIKSYKSSSPTHFNIHDYIEIRNSNTRSSTFTKMTHQRSSSNIFHNSYFCRLPRLWNSLPPIDLSSPTNTIKYKLLHFYGIILLRILLTIHPAPSISIALAPNVQPLPDHHFSLFITTNRHPPLLIILIINYLIML